MILVRERRKLVKSFDRFQTNIHFILSRDGFFSVDSGQLCSFLRNLTIKNDKKIKKILIL